MSEQITAEILRRIATEVRPKLELPTFKNGYDCCGCGTYESIVEDIEAIVREVAAKQSVMDEDGR